MPEKTTFGGVLLAFSLATLTLILAYVSFLAIVLTCGLIMTCLYADDPGWAWLMALVGVVLSLSVPFLTLWTGKAAYRAPRQSLGVFAGPGVLRKITIPRFQYRPSLKHAVSAGIVVFCVLVFIAAKNILSINPGHREGGSKGPLGKMRSALSIYYGDTEGTYPNSLEELVQRSPHIDRLPKTNMGHRAPNTSVVYYRAVVSGDAGGWGYVNNPADANFGSVFIDCTHTDSQGKTWASY